MPRLFCGTSGFAYASWKPEFYPPKVASKNFLAYYGSRLNAVEINYTFRRLPQTSTLESWVKATPEAFVFCVKAHQRITHIQGLKESEFVSTFFNSIDPLRSARRLGTVLFQTPPSLKCDPPLLDRFLAALPEGYRCAFEFRNASWLADPIYELLKKHGAALCLAESDTLEIPEVITADFVYARLRKSDYSVAARQEIATRTARFLSSGRDLYVFFKHEESAAGALYAEELLKSVGQV
jgi:uncharacterized protein YecE (DUF72 family)